MAIVNLIFIENFFIKYLHTYITDHYSPLNRIVTYIASHTTYVDRVLNLSILATVAKC